MCEISLIILTLGLMLRAGFLKLFCWWHWRNHKNLYKCLNKNIYFWLVLAFLTRFSLNVLKFKDLLTLFWNWATLKRVANPITSLRNSCLRRFDSSKMKNSVFDRFGITIFNEKNISLQIGWKCTAIYWEMLFDCL